MKIVLLATENGLAVAHSDGQTWSGSVALDGLDCQAVAFDPHRPGRAYCGTYDGGLWISDDGGTDWRQAGGEMASAHVMSVAVSPLEVGDAGGLLWVGTEPSRLFLSQDGGLSWQEREGLQTIPSRSTWRFPPRPWTHHVRWIEPDPCVSARIFVGIELGGVMRSLDHGLTWEDHKPNSQHDCHTLRTHPAAAGTLYEAAGGGFAASYDGGASWSRPIEGLKHHYVYGLAVDSGDPSCLIVSASYGPQGAHSVASGDSHLYRKIGAEPWSEMSIGLPAARGTRVYILAHDPDMPGHFYAATGSALYYSVDKGESWIGLSLDWPDGWDSAGANGLAVGRLSSTRDH